ncbi:hypothetical protein D3C78_1979650 [compost metagenome]
MGKALDELLAQAHITQGLRDPLTALDGIEVGLVTQRLSQDLADSHPRIER